MDCIEEIEVRGLWLRVVFDFTKAEPDVGVMRDCISIQEVCVVDERNQRWLISVDQKFEEEIEDALFRLQDDAEEDALLRNLDDDDRDF